jgi:hypothetical protein
MKKQIAHLAAAWLVLVPGAVFASTGKIKTDLEQGALRYFLENAHPETGLVRDKAESFGPTPLDNRVGSIAATGFGLTVFTNAALRGLIPRQAAKDYFDRVTRFCRDHVPREHGWFLHFINWDDGQSAWDDYNDYSSIDTALFLAGALYAAHIFPQSEGARITRELYKDADFYWMMTDGGRYPDRRTLSLGYDPKSGFIPYQWSIYAEQMILVVLGLGHPTHPLPPEVWDAWERRTTSFAGFDLVGPGMPLFVHQYSQMFIDFRHFKDKYINYFDNSVTATLLNREVSLRDTDYETFRAGFWGLSAGEAPGILDAVYRVFNPVIHEGIVCIGCAIGSAAFLPQVVLHDAEAWKSGPYGERIWGRYGFTDSLDLSQDWVSQRTFAITAGTAYMSLANLDDDTSIWKVFNQIPAIKGALAKIGVIEDELPRLAAD